MGEVVALKMTDRRAPDLLDELLEGVVAGFNRVVELGKFDKASTRVVMGYLAAGSIALRCNGLDQAASDFQSAGEDIEANWQAFERVIRQLASKYGRPS